MRSASFIFATLAVKMVLTAFTCTILSMAPQLHSYLHFIVDVCYQSHLIPFMHITSCGLIYSHTYYHSKLLGTRESYKTEHIAITHDLDQFNADYDLSVSLHTSCIVNKGFLVDEHTTKMAYQPQKT